MLVLQLKRFEYSVYSRHKVTKKVDYQTSLDLAPFMSKPAAGSLVRAPSVGPSNFVLMFAYDSTYSIAHDSNGRERHLLRLLSSVLTPPGIQLTRADPAVACRSTTSTECWSIRGIRCTRAITTALSRPPMGSGTRWTTARLARYTARTMQDQSHGQSLLRRSYEQQRGRQRSERIVPYVPAELRPRRLA